MRAYDVLYLLFSCDSLLISLINRDLQLQYYFLSLNMRKIESLLKLLIVSLIFIYFNLLVKL